MPPQAQQKKRQVGKAAIISDALPDLGSTSTLKIAELTTKLGGTKASGRSSLVSLGLERGGGACGSQVARVSRPKSTV